VIDELSNTSKRYFNPFFVFFKVQKQKTLYFLARRNGIPGPEKQRNRVCFLFFEVV